MPPARDHTLENVPGCQGVETSALVRANTTSGRNCARSAATCTLTLCIQPSVGVSDDALRAGACSASRKVTNERARSAPWPPASHRSCAEPAADRWASQCNGTRQRRARGKAAPQRPHHSVRPPERLSLAARRATCCAEAATSAQHPPPLWFEGRSCTPWGCSVRSSDVRAATPRGAGRREASPPPLSKQEGCPRRGARPPHTVAPQPRARCPPPIHRAPK